MHSTPFFAIADHWLRPGISGLPHPDHEKKFYLTVYNPDYETERFIVDMDFMDKLDTKVREVFDIPNMFFQPISPGNLFVNGDQNFAASIDTEEKHIYQMGWALRENFYKKIKKTPEDIKAIKDEIEEKTLVLDRFIYDQCIQTPKLVSQ